MSYLTVSCGIVRANDELQSPERILSMVNKSSGSISRFHNQLATQAPIGLKPASRSVTRPNACQQCSATTLTLAWV